MATKIRDCTEAVTNGRQYKAEQFLSVAAIVREIADSEEEVGDALVSLYVLAGIAAADVICCKALGHHAQGEDHLQAIGELSKVIPDGRQLGKDLKRFCG